jgi:hypothetical protein
MVGRLYAVELLTVLKVLPMIAQIIRDDNDDGNQTRINVLDRPAFPGANNTM